MAVLAPLAAGDEGIGGTQLGMLVGAVGLLTLLMISTRRRQRASRNTEHPSARDRYATMKRETEAKRDVEQVIYELDQVARQIHGRLDTKLARLEVVIRDADDRIDRLSRLVRSAAGAATVDVTLDRAQPNDAPPASASTDPHATVCGLADSGLAPAEVAEKVGMPIGEVELILALRKAKESAEQATPAGQPASA